MIEMLTETYQDLFIYSSYVFVLLYLLIFIYKQWSQIHTSQYPLKNIDTFLIIGDPNLTNQAINRLDIFYYGCQKPFEGKKVVVQMNLTDYSSFNTKNRLEKLRGGIILKKRKSFFLSISLLLTVILLSGCAAAETEGAAFHDYLVRPFIISIKALGEFLEIVMELLSLSLPLS